MGYFVVASGLHIGEKRSCLGEGRFEGQFVNEISQQYDEIEELILFGDILELNLSAVNTAIDGTPGFSSQRRKGPMITRESGHYSLSQRSSSPWIETEVLR